MQVPTPSNTTRVTAISHRAPTTRATGNTGHAIAPVRPTNFSSEAQSIDRAKQPSVRSLLDALRGMNPIYGVPMAAAFVRAAFADPQMVEAYLCPKPMPAIEHAEASTEPGDLPAWIPFEAASLAARQATAMRLVQPFERGLTHVATMLYPCGLFHGARIASLNEAQGPTKPFDFDQVARLRQLLLEDPLRQLKAQHIAVGNTLAAVLGQPYDVQDVDTEQVARVSSAVLLANLKVTAIWAPVPT
jgi:hypothetical protein